MASWQDLMVSPTATIHETIKIIDISSMQVALVVDEERRLVGTVTDGDIRRGLLRGIGLGDATHLIMNRRPTCAQSTDSREAVLAIMRSTTLHQIPVIDSERHVIGLHLLDDLLVVGPRDNWVILMAGGLGKRLRPLTDHCPKPMLKIGDKPILENILCNFIEQGFNHFFLSINYMASTIRDYFGNGRKWGVRIEYLHEDQALGTAGALSLLPEKPTQPFLVMNGDLLTKVNFGSMLDFHEQHGAGATMAVRDYELQVPYGVVRINDHHILSIEEKPRQRFFVNAGIYVLEPESLDYIPEREFYDMPTLFEHLIRQGITTSVFPIREYWLDIGQLSDFERARVDYGREFP